jgi:ABC-type phosphate/phosphonate transport system permease subunit
MRRDARWTGPYAARFAVFGLLLAAGVWAVLQLGLGWHDVRVEPGAGELARAFFGRALSPALHYEGDDVPPGTRPILLQAARAAWHTLVFAAAAMALAVPCGLLLGYAGSATWWASGRDQEATRGRRGGWFARAVGPVLSGGSRLLAAGMRSVHELLWAVLFLAAFGITPLSALLALSLPFAGILAKVFAELLDEAPRAATGALREAGATAGQAFGGALLPQAAPDLIAYALYRFECALRSSAVLGFFGFPTLGYFIAAAFENLHYGEVWTYLFTLVALVATVDWWSGAVRRRLAA